MDSSSATLRRLLSTSKMPPQLGELCGEPADKVTDGIEIEVFHVSSTAGDSYLLNVSTAAGRLAMRASLAVFALVIATG